MSRALIVNLLLSSVDIKPTYFGATRRGGIRDYLFCPSKNEWDRIPADPWGPLSPKQGAIELFVRVRGQWVQLEISWILRSAKKIINKYQGVSNVLNSKVKHEKHNPRCMNRSGIFRYLHLPKKNQQTNINQAHVRVKHKNIDIPMDASYCGICVIMCLLFCGQASIQLEAVRHSSPPNATCPS